jgi:hypothetical protein
MLRKLNKNNVLVICSFVIMLWFMLTNAIQAISCPNMTQTELFLHIPKTMLLNWYECE